MFVVNVPGTEIKIDYCKSCQNIWFDKNEWGLTEQSLAPKENLKDLESLNYKYGKALIEAQYSTKEHEVESLRISDNKARFVLGLFGLPTESDKDNFLVQPVLTWALIFLITAISVVGFKNMDWFVKNLAFVFNSNELILSFFKSYTSIFVHADWLHLLSNLYFLWIFGDNVEDYLGKRKYFLLLFFAALGSTAVYSVYHFKNDTPIIGASGMISGVIAFYVMRFPKRRFVFLSRFGFLNVSAIIFGGFYIFTQMLYSLIELTSSGGGIAFSAHIGGFLAGVIFFYIDLFNNNSENI
ncbi:rhomboid family intramembrane serine protease [bacterium]|nr:rhomboid family intramembrane serine protease [bacterium]